MSGVLLIKGTEITSYGHDLWFIMKNDETVIIRLCNRRNLRYESMGTKNIMENVKLSSSGSAHATRYFINSCHFV